jgi:hypothetical protein
MRMKVLVANELLTTNCLTEFHWKFARAKKEKIPINQS